MADTRRAMHVLEGSDADAGLVRSVLVADSEAEATIAFTLLRGSVDDSELLMLANLREVLAELPPVPFRAGEALDVLSRADGYEDTGRSYRRLFETEASVVGVEFVGCGHDCTDIAIHTPAARRSLRTEQGELEPLMLALFVRHTILLDAVLEALGLLGWPMEPPIYLTVDDFLADHGATVTSEAIDGLF
jgi:hypothetical protein